MSLLLVSSMYAQETNQLDINNKRHGPWKKTYDHTKQLRYEGKFEHGQEVDTFKFYDIEGGHPTAIKRYTKGSDVLDVSFYTIDGKKVSQGKMRNRVREGEWIFYHQDGSSILSREFYTNGQKNGTKTDYFINGAIALEEFYKDGERDGSSTHYTENKTVLKEFTYNKGLLHGSAKIYDALGQLIKEGAYKRNRKDGIWTYYENGTVVKKVHFPQNKIGVEHK